MDKIFKTRKSNTEPTTVNHFEFAMDFETTLVLAKQVEQMFNMFQKKYNIECKFPTIFNGKKVEDFDFECRPLDINGDDMIELFWNSKPALPQCQGGIAFFKCIIDDEEFVKRYPNSEIQNKKRNKTCKQFYKENTEHCKRQKRQYKTRIIEGKTEAELEVYERFLSYRRELYYKTNQEKLRIKSKEYYKIKTEKLNRNSCNI